MFPCGENLLTVKAVMESALGATPKPPTQAHKEES